MKAAGHLAGLCLAVAASTCQGSSQRAPDPNPASSTSLTEPELADVIYDRGVKGGWQAGGTAPQELAPGSPAKIRFSDNGEWILSKPNLAGQFGGVVFRVRMTPGDGEFLEVGLRAGTTSAAPPTRPAFVKIAPDYRRLLDDDWVEVSVPMEALDPDGRPFDRVVMRAFRPVDNAWVLIDKVGLVRGGTPRAAAGGAAPVAAVASGVATPMRIVCNAAATRISPFIYGLGGVDAGHLPMDVGATIYRWGGNRSSRYNWEAHLDNAASDWFFENHDADDWTQFLATNSSAGKTSALTIPIVGWVAKDATSFSFPVSVFGPQNRTDPSHPDAGDGTKPGGAKIRPGPPDRTSIPAPPEWDKRWVQAIRAIDAKTGGRSVMQYILDNEPMLWSATHRDLHPDPLGYDELLDRTIRYATAIREADPEATIAGPAEWGWVNYLYSARDLAPGVIGKPDHAAHGGVPLVEWYLRKLRDHERETKVRVLDVLDLHYYPQQSGVYSDKDDLQTAVLRLRATRSLWDPSYVDESWIHEPVSLLPRMREWIDKAYPGRGISIGEWNFGGEKHVSGALATAEALGRFGQYGVTSAFYWTAPPAGSQSGQGFLAYRNFDGHGGRFLDWSLPTSSPAGVSLFASRDEEGKHLVAVIINMAADQPRRAQIDVGTCGAIASRRDFVYLGGGFAGETPAQGAASSLEQTLPPWSITVIDVGLAQPLPKKVTP